jgi:hypothetical protein
MIKEWKALLETGFFLIEIHQTTTSLEIKGKYCVVQCSS